MNYYNDNEPFVAQWLRNLIEAGLIPPGDVDERSILEVEAVDLVGYTQVHLFAGIAGWSLALQLAGWPEDRPVWTASCPCPPFSSAGKKGKKCPSCEGGVFVWSPGRTGYAVCVECSHEWMADDRHLWPEVWRLVSQRRPSVVFGEQVNSPAGRDWFGVVQSSLEVVGYTAGAVDLPAASVGAPHIRQRLFWMADSECSQRRSNRLQEFTKITNTTSDSTKQLTRSCNAGRLADSECDRAGRTKGKSQPVFSSTSDERVGKDYIEPGPHGTYDGMGDPDFTRPFERNKASETTRYGGSIDSTNWDDLEWLPCIDEKQRPTQPGLQPLAHEVPSRVGRLRAYGNAIVPQAAAKFIEVCMEVIE